MDRKDKIEYILIVVGEFARINKMGMYDAYLYIKNHRGMEKENIDMHTAIERTLGSKTYQLLCDASTALSWQSAGYVYEVYRQIG